MFQYNAIRSVLFEGYMQLKIRQNIYVNQSIQIKIKNQLGQSILLMFCPIFNKLSHEFLIIFMHLFIQEQFLYPNQSIFEIQISNSRPMMKQTFEIRNIITRQTLQDFSKYLKINKLSPQVYAVAVKTAFQNYKPHKFIQYFQLIKNAYEKIVQDQIFLDQSQNVTLLMKLCQTASAQQIVKMIQWKVPFHTVDKTEKNCLFYAVQNNFHGQSVINLILTKYPDYIQKSIDQQGYTLLHQSIDRRKHNIALMLLKNDKVNPNLKGKVHHQTPMHILLKKSDKKNKFQVIEVLEALLSRGADPNARDIKGNTPVEKIKDQGLKKEIGNIIHSFSQQKKSKSGSKKQSGRNNEDRERMKGKSEFGRDQIKQYNNALKEGINKSKVSTIIVVQDQKAIMKQANDLFEAYVKRQEALRKMQRMQQKKKKKQQRNRIISPDQLKYYLQQDINLTVEKIEEFNEKTRDLHQELIKNVTERVTRDLPIQVQIFGSFATGLCLPESDIDMVIIPKQNCKESPLSVLEKVNQILESMTEQISYTKLIRTATVPIIKLECTKKYMQKKIDITYKDENHNGPRAAKLIKNYIKNYKELKSLAFILKKFIYASKLFDPYSGGISSYGLILMIVAYIQNETQRRKRHKLQPALTSELLIGFLRFFGFDMDYIEKCIYVEDPQELQTIHSLSYMGCLKSATIYDQYRDLSPKLIIMDPLNNANNVGRATHKMKQIKMAFEIAYVCIHTNNICGKKRKCESFNRIKNGYVAARYSENAKPCCILQRMFKSTQMFIRNDG